MYSFKFKTNIKLTWSSSSRRSLRAYRKNCTFRTKRRQYKCLRGVWTIHTYKYNIYLIFNYITNTVLLASLAYPYLCHYLMYILTYCRKWTPSMGDILSRVRKQILKDITNYLKNEDKNVLKVCILLHFTVN